jgi:hypothetical protein
VKSPVFWAAAAAILAAVLLLSWAIRWKPAGEESPVVTAAVEDGGVSHRFSGWSLQSDAFLLVDMVPDEHTPSVYNPHRYYEMRVSVGADGGVTLTLTNTFAWDGPDHEGVVRKMREEGFEVNGPGEAPPTDRVELYGEAARSASADVQTVVLTSRSGKVVELRRTRAEAAAKGTWGQRAIGFLSPDGRLVYVVPDDVVVPAR